MAKRAEARGKDFASSLAALERIVRELERGDLPLEKSLELFEEGVRLSRECQERLNEAERRIEILLRDGEGRPVLASFDEEAFDDGNEAGFSRAPAVTEDTEEDEGVF